MITMEPLTINCSGGAGCSAKWCARKSSEDRFLNRVEKTYGPECHVHYGDWARKDQMAGCEPSPTVGLKKALTRRFRVTEVDEHLTSRMCNLCRNRLESYIKMDGRRSYSRLCCTNCEGRWKNRSKLFIDRDVNAASNILLVGMSEKRPRHLQRSGTRPVIDATGSSSDPMLP